MKDILITKVHIKLEIIIWLYCFGAAFLLNVYAIIKYNNSWLELLSQLHIVILISLVFYFLVGLTRIIIWLLKSLFMKLKK